MDVSHPFVSWRAPDVEPEPMDIVSIVDDTRRLQHVATFIRRSLRHEHGGAIPTHVLQDLLRVIETGEAVPLPPSLSQSPSPHPLYHPLPPIESVDATGPTILG